MVEVATCRWLVGAALLISTSALPVSAAESDALLAEGRYVYLVAGCVGCHVDADRVADGPAGGKGLETPFGVYYPPNITPHPQYGIGNWSEDDLLVALRHGRAPDGYRYAPVFPYTSYTRMRERDVRALYAYLMSLEPVARPSRAHQLPWYLPAGLANRAWQLMFFRAGVFTPNPSRDDQWNRGAYIATALAHCGECHTPRNLLGATDLSRPYAGNPDGVEGDAVPNISSDPDHGVGKWRVSELVDYLDSGMTPEADFAGGAMAEVIDNGLTHLTDEDREALASYVHRLPPMAD